MAFTLEITFGGLILVVEEPHSAVRGLYLLMPEMADHEPTLTFDGQHLSTGTPGSPVTRKLCGKSVDATGIKPHGKLQKKNRSRFAMMSTVIGSTAVHPDWLTIPPTASPSGMLAARIRLPLLDRPMEPYGDLARLSYGPPSTTNPGLWYAGRGRVRLAVKKSPIVIEYDASTKDELSDVSGFMELHVRNSAPTPATRPKAGDPVPHMRGYWRFLDRPGASAGRYQDFIVVDPGPPPTQDDPESLLGREGIRGVDPAQCTIGSGCSFNDSCP